MALLVMIGYTVCAAAEVPIFQPGAPGQPGRVVSEREAADLSKAGVTPADIKFMQDMIQHHAQAVAMTALLRDRTRRDDMRQLGRRISLSQADEIHMMRDWLRDQRAADDAMAGHAMGGTEPMLMPGMLTPEEMARLAAAHGTDFDRLFLAGMITHHEGALAMVKALFATPGAGQDAQVFTFASDVDSSQRAEIQRMSSLLDAIQAESGK